MSDHLELIPEKYRKLASEYYQNRILLTPNRSQSQCKLHQETQQLIKWMSQNHVAESFWVKLVYKIFSQFRMFVLPYFEKMFAKIPSKMMAQWTKHGGDIFALLVQIGLKTNKSFKYEDFGYKKIDALIKDYTSADNLTIKKEQPEQIHLQEVQLAIYRFLYKARSWSKRTQTKIEEKLGVKIDTSKETLSIEQMRNELKANEFEEEIIECEQLKDDDDYITQHLEKHMNCFQIHFYKIVRVEYRKFVGFFNKILVRKNKLKMESNLPSFPVTKLPQLKEQHQDEESKKTKKNQAGIKSTGVQNELNIEELKLEEIDFALIKESDNNETLQDGQIPIKYKYYQRPIFKKEIPKTVVKQDYEPSKKQRMKEKNNQSTFIEFTYKDSSPLKRQWANIDSESDEESGEMSLEGIYIIPPDEQDILERKRIKEEASVKKESTVKEQMIRLRSSIRQRFQSRKKVKVQEMVEELMEELRRDDSGESEDDQSLSSEEEGEMGYEKRKKGRRQTTQRKSRQASESPVPRRIYDLLILEDD